MSEALMADWCCIEVHANLEGQRVCEQRINFSSLSIKWPARAYVKINRAVLSCKVFCMFAKAAVAVG